VHRPVWHGALRDVDEALQATFHQQRRSIARYVDAAATADDLGVPAGPAHDVPVAGGSVVSRPRVNVDPPGPLPERRAFRESEAISRAHARARETTMSAVPIRSDAIGGRVPPRWRF
jgi:hypothetical protein